MHNLLSQYLIDLLHKNSCVILPGFGGFVSNYTSATVDSATDYFSPPSLNIAFNLSLTHNDGLLIQEISKRESLTQAEASEKAQSYIAQLRKTIYTHGRADLEGLGLLYLDKDYEIKFKVALKANLLPQSYGLRSFRFASTKNRNRAQSLENEYMRTVSGNKKTIIATTVAASVVVLLGLTFFINRNIDFSSTVESSIGSIDNALINNGIDNAVSKKVAPVNIESSTKKSHALYYNEIKNTTEYHIIAGSFTTIETAKRFGKTLEDEGYTPNYIVDGDKVRISIYSHRDKYEALRQLDFLRATKEKAVWLLKLDKTD